MNNLLRATITLSAFGLIVLCAFIAATATGSYPAGFMLFMVGAELFAFGAIIWAMLAD